MIIPGTVDLSWNSLKRFLWTYQDCFHGNHPGFIFKLENGQFMIIYYIIYMHSKMKIDWLIFIGRVIDLQSDINQYWPIRMEYNLYFSANLDRTLYNVANNSCARSSLRRFVIFDNLDPMIILSRSKIFRSYNQAFKIRELHQFYRWCVSGRQPSRIVPGLIF